MGIDDLIYVSRDRICDILVMCIGKRSFEFHYGMLHAWSLINAGNSETFLASSASTLNVELLNVKRKRLKLRAITICG